MTIEFLQLILGRLSSAFAGAVIGKLLRNFRSPHGKGMFISRVSERTKLRNSDFPLRKLLRGATRRIPDTLVLNKLRISNHGNLAIDKVDLLVKVTPFEGSIEFLIADVADPRGKMTCRKFKDSLRLKRDFLNPLCFQKKEKITLSILSNTRLTFSVDGAGSGWDSTFEDQSLPEGQAKRIWLGLFMVTVLSLFVLTVSDSPEFRHSLFRVSVGVFATLCEFWIAWRIGLMVWRSHNQSTSEVPRMAS